MNWVRRLTVAFLVAWIVPRPVQAQGSPGGYLDLGPAPYLAAAGVALYVVGGGVTFLAVDVHHAAKRRALPPAWAVAQGIYGASFMATGLVALQEEDKIPAITLLAIGATVAAYPLVDWRLHAGHRAIQTSLRLTPTGVLVSGTF
jgi:hypothetical protein